jgi:uncharacterized protein (TIGR03067 family)
VDKLLTTVVVLLICICAVGCSSGKEATPLPPEVTGKEVPSPSARKELDKMKGIWIAVNGRERGKEMDEARLDEYTIRITDHLIEHPGRFPPPYTYLATVDFRIDPDTQPKHFDFLQGIWSGDAPYRTHLGLYELDGDTLTLCWVRSAGKRPANFDDGPEVYRVVFHRKPVEGKEDGK